MGEEDFIDRFIDHVRGYEKIKENPRAQRYLADPALKDLFPENIIRNRNMRDEGIVMAVGEWGYSQREVADYLSLHYSISKI